MTDGATDGSQGARVVLVTTPDADAAETLVTELVEEGVVACGNILPGIRSIFRWEGQVENSTEALVVFKTTADGAARLMERVPALHPYDVPEVLVLPVEAGHRPYLDWIAESVGGRSWRKV